MKILQVHNYYQQSGGEDVVVVAERELLQAHGHDVRFYSISNNAVKGVSKKIKTAWQAPYSKSARLHLATEIVSFKPNIVHVHNWFPLLTPSIYDACKMHRIPVVQSLHNYRTICANSFFLRKGEICEKCISKTPFNAVAHRCYRNSFFGSLAVARMISRHRNQRTWARRVDCFIALTEFAKKKFTQCGFPDEKMHVKPNFLTDQNAQENQVKRSGGLFVGRLSEEKGIRILLDSWRGLDASLRIVGDGELTHLPGIYNISSVKALGRLDSKQTLAEMDSAQFFVVPSLWYEGFPMVVVEAYSRGLPIIASRIGSLAEIVKDGTTGLLVEPGSPVDLREKIVWALNNRDAITRMGQQARKTYEEKYTAETNYLTLMNIYQQAIKYKNI